MRVDLDDDLVDRLQAERPNAKLTTILADKFKLVEGLKVGDKTLILRAKHLRELEDRLGLSATQSPEALVEAVAKALAVTLGGQEIPFTPHQLREMSTRAARNGRTLEQELKDQVYLFHELLFSSTVSTAYAGVPRG